MKKNLLHPLLIILAFNSTHLFAQNTKLGINALANVTTGTFNTALGYYSLYSNTTGSYNSATGAYSLYSNTSGYGNTANGFRSLLRNTTGIYNKADGYYALSSNTGGGYNTALGANALYSNTTAGYNTSTGSNSLYRNTTGSANTANGYQSLYSNTNGGSNTSLGYSSLYLNTTGYGNTAAGGYAMYHNTTGSYNKADGYYALLNNTTGNYNTALGAFADVAQGGLTNATAIGYGAIVNASNKVVIGRNIAGMVIGGYAPWSNFSDGRFKENIRENVPGLKFINKLRPVTYTINTDKLEEYIMKEMPDSVKSRRMQKDEHYSKAVMKIQTGFVAQEVEKTANELGYDFDGVNAPQSPVDNYSISYTQFIMPLVKAVQELAKLNDDKEAKIESLKKQLEELRSIVLSGSPKISFPLQNITKADVSRASLEQNNPNPSPGNTTIAYTLPQKFTAAQISITDMSGKLLRQINVSGNGKGAVQLNTNSLSSGTYNYSLIIDGQLVSTKQMILTQQ